MPKIYRLKNSFDHESQYFLRRTEAAKYYREHPQSNPVETLEHSSANYQFVVMLKDAYQLGREDQMNKIKEQTSD